MIASAQILVNIPMIVLALLGSCAVGYLIRRKSIKKLNKRIIELENDMLVSHRQLLRMEEEMARRLPAAAMSATVISIPVKTNQKKAN